MQPYFKPPPRTTKIEKRAEHKKDKRLDSQVEHLVEQLRDRMNKVVKERVKDGDEEKPRIKSLQWDGIDWKMSFDQNVASSKRSTL